MARKKYKKLRKQLRNEPEFDEDGEVNPYHGYTVKDYKRDHKAHKQRMRAERKENRKGTGNHPLNK